MTGGGQDSLSSILYAVLIIILSAVLIKQTGLGRRVQVWLAGLSNRLLVWLVTTTDTQYSKRWRGEMFRCMRNEMGVKVLEIGSGGGANFQYYPLNSAVICLEPVGEFDEYLHENFARYGAHLKEVNVLRGVVEDLPSLVPANSVDYVVCTYVLCSVKDVGEALRNIAHVLKPGGKFCYLEHTHSDNYPMRFYQSIVTPLFSLIFNGCHYNREPHSMIEDSNLFIETVFYLQLASSLPIYHPERTQVWGHAIKMDPEASRDSSTHVLKSAHTSEAMATTQKERKPSTTTI